MFEILPLKTLSMSSCSYCVSTEGEIVQTARVWLSSLLVISVYIQITNLSVRCVKHRALRMAGKECKSTHKHPTHPFLFLFGALFFHLISTNSEFISPASKKHRHINNTHHILWNISCMPLCSFLLQTINE